MLRNLGEPPLKTIASFLGYAAIALLLAGLAGHSQAQRKAKPRDAMKLSPPVKVGRADIGGVVSGEKGAEARGWGVAPTTDPPPPQPKGGLTHDKGPDINPGPPEGKEQPLVGCA